MLHDALDQLPCGVKKVFLRSDGAGYQESLLRYCAEGKHERFGLIEFSISARVSESLKQAVRQIDEKDWQVLSKQLEDQWTIETEQQWAELCFVPSWHAKKGGPDYRYVVIREKLSKQSDNEQALPFPTVALKEQVYKISAIVTNRKLDAQELIHWHRQRCGESEKIHSVLKSDFAGAQFPSSQFGANAA